MKLKTLFAIVTMSAVYIPCLGVVTNVFADKTRDGHIRWDAPMNGVEKFINGIHNIPDYPCQLPPLLFALMLLAFGLDVIVCGGLLLVWELAKEIGGDDGTAQH